ncbi:hypothetical protein Cni_G27081 [Canna indica]|uniref:Uncharacterized protein n=1 Tax=Canna indica TaxID=4628 RepID=A0AAQ3L034_9LILI|nr:hypothetical protein Cni_G27081 [Canna indica]
MVVTLGPGKFYGSSLPRPRFYTDVKLNDSRVDPPAPVMDPLLSWANEAHWSMGGLSFQRHRLQGRIEGSVKKLRAQQEKKQRQTPSPASAPAPRPAISKPRVAGHAPPNLSTLDSSDSEEEAVAGTEKGGKATISPPPNGSAERKRKRVRRLGEEFDKIAAEQLGGPREGTRGVASRTRSRRPEDAVAADVGKKGSPEGKKRKVLDGMPRRTSPRKKQLA